jgi:XTP/dITP diphosphohydrolase
MKKIVFATHNAHKLEEVRMILKDKFNVVGLSDLGCFEEIPETAETLEENALAKARFVFEKYGLACFADDTGLEVDTLNGKPGIYSARYAGEPSNSFNNVRKILKEMDEMSNRKAQFRTVIALIEQGEATYFEGIIKGQIGREVKGNNGFGYDPVFIPEGSDLSFAQMDSSIKNTISHRALAIQKLVDYLMKV